ncbi:MAG: hypothetical protein KDA25_06620 [Phycisphaerales bacterium]|nr:hypothetical protein [Phycisphaerales bacterium]
MLVALPVVAALLLPDPTVAAPSALRVVPEHVELTPASTGFPATGEMWVINGGDAPLTVTSFQLVCGCGRIAPWTPTTLAPGEARHVPLRYTVPAKPVGTVLELPIRLEVEGHAASYGIVSTVIIDPLERRVRDFRARRDDPGAARDFFAPGSRIWFERREGDGAVRAADGAGPWSDWDRELRARSRATDFDVDVAERRVTFLLHETNDFGRLLERAPSVVRMTYWFDDADRVRGTLVEGVPPTDPAAAGRLEEFLEWASANRAEALAAIRPNGRIEPSAAAARRWREILLDWRRSTYAPAIDLEAPVLLR